MSSRKQRTIHSRSGAGSQAAPKSGRPSGCGGKYIDRADDEYIGDAEYLGESYGGGSIYRSGSPAPRKRAITSSSSSSYRHGSGYEAGSPDPSDDSEHGDSTPHIARPSSVSRPRSKVGSSHSGSSSFLRLLSLTSDTGLVDQVAEWVVNDEFAWDKYLQTSRYFDDPFGVREMGDLFKSSSESTHFSPTRFGPSKPSSNVDHGRQASRRRAYILKAAETAVHFDDFELREFFTIQGGVGRKFVLTPPFPTPIKFQQYRKGPEAIDDRLADKRCIGVTPSWLLDTLNSVLGTPDRALSRDVVSVLQTFIDEDFDFGQIYGMLRPWWFDRSTQFSEIIQRMLQRKREDRDMRRKAMDGECITNPHVPPRRVWDLHSNRVLPYHVLNISRPAQIPANLWAVSHSWLHPTLRQSVQTPINQELWPVPIPAQTTLEHVRIELLNLGAEYVFLDVLCLRQKGDSFWEFTRKKEWKLDVPTIGHVYQANLSQTTVTYFNGLGMEFAFSPQLRRSPTHWLNRVWTTQEATLNWLPGGVADAAPFQKNARTEQGHEFGASLKRIFSATQLEFAYVKLYDIINIVRERAFTNEVDRVSSMAYLLRCDTLPVYDEDVDVEDVWDALVQHMPPRLRTDLLMTWPWPGTAGGGRCRWRPSWTQLVDERCDLSAMDLPEIDYHDDELLQFESQGRLDNWDAYCHRAFLIEGVSVTRADKDTYYSVAYDSGHRSPLVLQMRGYVDEVDQDDENEYTFCLVGLRRGLMWVVGRVRGGTMVGENRGPIVRKVGTVTTTTRDGNAMLDGLCRERKLVFITYT